MSDIVSKAISEINTHFGVSISEEIIFDGKIHRPKDEKGSDHLWYVANEWIYKGHNYQQIKVGSWRGNKEIVINSWDDAKVDKNFKKDYSKKMAESIARLEQEKKVKHKKCRDKWKPLYNKTKSTDEIHPYLAFKGIDDNSMSKILNGILLVPVYNARDGLVGVQQIFYDDATQKYVKRFSTGIEIRGGFCPLKPFKNEEFCFIVEGFVTGKSVQLAYPDIPVIVVFNAGNIIPAIEHIRHINQKIKIIIAGDHDQPDQRGRRAGFHFAQRASVKFPNVIFKIPKFKINNPEWSDFNDLHQFESLDKVKEQLKFDPSDFAEVKCLGYKNDNYFYTSSENTQIVSMSSSAHANKFNLLSLATINYWQKHYPILDENDDIVKIDFTLAAAKMMANCRDQGFFDPDNLRGRGVWLDDGRIIINTGESTYVDGLISSTFTTKYHYIRTNPLPFDLDEPMSDEEMTKLLGVFGSLRYKNPHDYVYLAAWLVQSSIFGVLPWRFHVWLSGEAGSGKSTILKWMKDLTIKCSPNQNSSAAGIRQDIQSDTIPVLYDESEPDGPRLKEVIEMARQSSSNGGFDTKRGTVSGKALVYNTQALFMMGSIQKGVEKEADLSRFFIIELTKEKQSIDEYEEMVRRISYFVERKRNIFSRCVLNAKNINQSFYVAQKIFREKKVEARYADQLSCALACFHLYFSTDPMDSDDLEFYIKKYDILNSEYIEQNKTKIHENCLEKIMTIKVDNSGHTVFHCIETMKDSKHSDDIDKSNPIEQMLGLFGMRFYPSSNQLFIANNCELIKKAIPEYRDYTSILKRDKKTYVEAAQRKICNYGNNIRGITVRLNGIS